MSNQNSMANSLKAGDLGIKKCDKTIKSRVEGQHQASRFKSKISTKVLSPFSKIPMTKAKGKPLIMMVRARTTPQKDWNTAFLTSAGLW